MTRLLIIMRPTGAADFARAAQQHLRVVLDEVRPGTSGIGAASTSSRVSVEATNVTYTGNATIDDAEDQHRRASRTSSQGRFSTIGCAISTAPCARRSGTARP